MQKYCYYCMRQLEHPPVCDSCGHDNSTPIPAAPYHLRPGTVLGERYLVGRVLGQGGFGITYIGLDITLSKRVAVKEFYPDGIVGRLAGDSNEVVVVNEKETFFDSGVDKFLDEAKNVAAFSDEEGIVDVLDYFNENGTAYIVMEYLEGETLKSYIKNHGTFDADTLITLLLPVMRSLKFIHSKGIIHRDISPDNIMYTAKGTLKLMDFGSARYFTNDQRQMSIILKRGFAPEEQYRQNGEQGPYTDIYALCATIYTCVTGRVPTGSLDRIVGDTLTPPSQLGISISRSCEQALMHGLAPLAKNRPQTMSELIAEFTAKSSDNATIDANHPVSVPIGKQEAPKEQAPKKAEPASPNEYMNAWKTPAKERTKRVPPRKKPAAAVIAASALVLAIIAGVSAVILMYIKKQNENNAVQTAATQYTVPPATSAAASVPPEYVSVDGLSLNAAKANTHLLRSLFSDKAALSDSEAKTSDEIALEEIYFCKSNDDDYTGIIFIYRNITAGYYKSLEIRPENVTVKDGVIVNIDDISFHENASAATLSEAAENCWPLSKSFRQFYTSTKLL